VTAMQYRDTLKNLTWVAAAAFVGLTVLTLLSQTLTVVLALVLALVVDFGERLVTMGKVLRDMVVEAGTVATPPMPTGYRTRDMAAWSTS
jgi:hypothetical protein